MPTALQMVEDLRAGRSRPSSVVDEALSLAAQGDPKVFSEVLATSARQAARESDARWARGAPLSELDGVPVAVKDLVHVAGTVPTLGSIVHPEEPSSEDAEIVRRLRRAGAVIVGRTWTHEHAWGITGQHPALGGPANPHDATRVTGGSSAGSAAAVASGIVPLAVGTDTAGSVRIPAAWCGVLGWKPTHGWASVDGVFELARSFDHLGLFATSVGDLVVAHRLLADEPLAAPSGAPQVGSALLTTPVADPRLAEHLAVVHRRLELPEVHLPDPERARLVQGTLQPVEALHVHRDLHGWWPGERQRFGGGVAERLEAAAGTTEEQVAGARRAREQLEADLEAAMAEVDLVVAPVVGCGPSLVADPDHAPPPVGGPLRDAVLGHTSLQTLFGLPALALPAGLLDGQPTSVQVFGRRGADADVLQAGAHLTAVLGA